jgi:hypothetical protein
MTGSALLFAQLPINLPIRLTNSLEVPLGDPNPVSREFACEWQLNGLPTYDQVTGDW